MMYYSYRKPPMYDDKMNSNIILLLYSGPVVFMGVGAWAFSNQMIFQNRVLPLVTGKVYPDSSFSIGNFFT